MVVELQSPGCPHLSGISANHVEPGGVRCQQMELELGRAGSVVTRPVFHKRDRPTSDQECYKSPGQIRLRRRYRHRENGSGCGGCLADLVDHDGAEGLFAGNNLFTVVNISPAQQHDKSSIIIATRKFFPHRTSPTKTPEATPQRCSTCSTVFFLAGDGR